jgi:hypothetical protein
MSLRPVVAAIAAVSALVFIVLPAHMHLRVAAAPPTNSAPVALNDSYTVHGATNIGPMLSMTTIQMVIHSPIQG